MSSEYSIPTARKSRHQEQGIRSKQCPGPTAPSLTDRQPSEARMYPESNSRNPSADMENHYTTHAANKGIARAIDQPFLDRHHHKQRFKYSPKVDSFPSEARSSRIQQHEVFRGRVKEVPRRAYPPLNSRLLSRRDETPGQCIRRDQRYARAEGYARKGGQHGGRTVRERAI